NRRRRARWWRRSEPTDRMRRAAEDPSSFCAPPCSDPRAWPAAHCEGAAGHPPSTALTPAIRHDTSTRPVPAQSNAGQLHSGRAPSAMLTPAISSFPATDFAPSQSPTHTAALVAVAVALALGVCGGGVMVSPAVAVALAVAVAIGVELPTVNSPSLMRMFSVS